MIMMMNRNLYFGGKNRQHVTLMVAVLLPAIIGGMTFCMNILWYITGSTQFIHFSTITIINDYYDYDYYDYDYDYYDYYQ